MKTPPPSGKIDVSQSSKENTKTVNSDVRPVSFYIPVNDLSVNQLSERKKNRTQSKDGENSEQMGDTCNYKLNHDEKMLQADILHQDQLNEKGEMSRKHQEKYEKAKSKREMIIENLRKKSEDKILRAEEKRKKRIAKQKEKLKAVEERLAKVRCRKETIDHNFREKTVTKLVEDEERLRTLQQSDLPLRAIFRREEILRYRQKLYEERQQCKERTVNKNQFL